MRPARRLRHAGKTLPAGLIHSPCVIPDAAKRRSGIFSPGSIARTAYKPLPIHPHIPGSTPDSARTIRRITPPAHTPAYRRALILPSGAGRWGMPRPGSGGGGRREPPNLSEITNARGAFRLRLPHPRKTGRELPVRLFVQASELLWQAPEDERRSVSRRFARSANSPPSAASLRARVRAPAACRYSSGRRPGRFPHPSGRGRGRPC